MVDEAERTGPYSVHSCPIAFYTPLRQLRLAVRKKAQDLTTLGTRLLRCYDVHSHDVLYGKYVLPIDLPFTPIRAPLIRFGVVVKVIHEGACLDASSRREVCRCVTDERMQLCGTLTEIVRKRRATSVQVLQEVSELTSGGEPDKVT